jgi:Domain of unknown function (DUF4062)
MKVYISSTFRDLREHRSAVALTLRRMGHDVIGMEEYVAEDRRAIARCYEDVQDADIYVLVLAWRYGFTPTEENPEALSITQLEYRRAVLIGKPVLAFLVDAEVPWPPSEMDSASANTDAANGISKFRAEIQTGRLSGMFSSPADLASQVAAAVARQGLTSALSERVLVGTSVKASEMGSFGGGGSMYDTSVRELKQMVVDVGSQRAVIVDLAGGDQWWSTRLFLLASLLGSLTTVRQVVFRGRTSRFVGMASPDAVLEGLGSRFQALADFAVALRRTPASQDRERETERQIGVWFEYLSRPASDDIRPARLQGTLSSFEPSSPRGGELSVSTIERERTIQEGVREELLSQWMGDRFISRCIEVRGALTMSQVQQIVDCLIPDVPVEMIGVIDPTQSDIVEKAPSAGDSVSVQGEAPSVAKPPLPKLYVVDRDSFCLELARSWVKAGLPRNPAL